MIKGQNKIICDECKKYVELHIESKRLTGDITIQYFRCDSCNEKYLIDVTDKATRTKQDDLRNLTKELKTIMENVTDETLLKVEKVSRDIYTKEEQLLKEIKEAKAELKAKYSELL